jgi:hypothetical protein
MNIMSVQKIHRVAGEHKKLPDVVCRWLMLCAAIFLLWLFMFVIAPWVGTFPLVKPLAQFIEDTGIDASALYYTEIDETAEAEMYLRDAARFAPADDSR